MRKRSEPSKRKRLGNVTHVLGEEPTKRMKRTIYIQPPACRNGKVGGPNAGG